MQHPKPLSLIALAVTLLVAPAAHAQSVKLKDVAGKAVLTNPEVLQKWHEFKAAGQDREVAWGRYLPTLDVVVGVAREKKSDPTFVPPGSRTYTRDGVTATLRENLFEGFGTQNETLRLDHARRVRYFELLDLSESAALEASRAYIDVMRFRRLVELSEENYATHRVIYEQIRERAESGVGRRADLEVASGRLALAESNLLTEVANLHDVSARYQRIVGEAPKGPMEEPASMAAGVETDPNKALTNAFKAAPGLLAAIANIQAAQTNVKVQQSRYYPRVDLKVETSRANDLNGFSGTYTTDTVELTASWNLFNGLADRARERSAAESANAAKDQRDKVCRDVRQTVLIAVNDTKKLADQLKLLDQHQLSIDKAREAFRRQFDIGQRTLLDLLDTENEYFESRRAYTNGDNDLRLSHVRVHAASGDLLKTIGLTPVEVEQPPEVEALNEDAAARCPAESPELTVSDKNGLFERAMAKAKLTRQSEAVPARPAPTATPAPAPAKVEPAAAKKKAAKKKPVEKNSAK